ncbi:MAG: DUF5664 domain-containing protein [Bacillota bacterium]|nr:DUF5664 domain-containing protein [Bacillota bacterium]
MMKDQTVKADAGKPRVSLVPSAIVRCIAPVREYGNDKYPEGGKDNWKKVDPERYIEAFYRHVLDFAEDPYSRDEESGLPHLWHAACNAAFLCELLDMTEEKDLLNSCDHQDFICDQCIHEDQAPMGTPCYRCRNSCTSFFIPKVKE